MKHQGLLCQILVFARKVKQATMNGVSRQDLTPLRGGRYSVNETTCAVESEDCETNYSKNVVSGFFFESHFRQLQAIMHLTSIPEGDPGYSVVHL